MAVSLGQVVATVSLNASKWRRGANQTAAANKKIERSMYRLGKRVDKTTRDFKRATSGIGRRAAVVGIAVVASFGAIIKQTAQASDELAKLARRLDVTVEFLQSLQFAADSYNISQRLITKGFTKFRSEIAAISAGAYSEAEVYVRDIDSGLLALITTANTSEEGLRRLFNTIKESADDKKSLALLNLLFSKRAGSSILQLIKEAPEGLDTYINRARELQAITGDQARLAEAVNQSFTDLSFVTANVLKRAMIDNRDAIIDMNTNLAEIVKDNAPLVITAFTNMAKAAGFIVEQFENIVTVLGTIKGFTLGFGSAALLSGGNPLIAVGGGVAGALAANRAIGVGFDALRGGNENVLVQQQIELLQRLEKIGNRRGIAGQTGRATQADVFAGKRNNRTERFAPIFGVKSVAEIKDAVLILETELKGIKKSIDKNGDDANNPPAVEPTAEQKLFGTNVKLLGKSSAELIRDLPDRITKGLGGVTTDLRNQLSDASGETTGLQLAARQIESVLRPIRAQFDALIKQYRDTGGGKEQIAVLEGARAGLDPSLYTQATIEVDRLNDALKQTQLEQSRIQEIAQGINSAFQSGLKSMIETGNVAKGLRSILAGIVAQIIQTTIISRLAGQASTFLSNLLSPAVLATGGAIGVNGGLTGVRAFGGPVSAGGLYKVNERSPEVFEPYSSGRVTPLNRLSGGMGSSNISFNIINSGTPKSVDTPSSNIDVESGVVQVVLKDLDERGPISQKLQGSSNLELRDF